MGNKENLKFTVWVKKGKRMADIHSLRFSKGEINSVLVREGNKIVEYAVDDVILLQISEPINQTG